MSDRYASLRIFSLIILLAAAVLFFFTERLPVPSPSDKEIVIGASLEMSGRFSATGKASLNSLRMAIAEVNSNGGLLGRPVRLVVVDNQSAEINGAAAMQELVEKEKACAIIGPSYSAIAVAGNNAAERLRVPFICTWGTGSRVTVDDLGRTRPFAFRACFLDNFQGSVMARFAAQTLGLQNAAIYLDESTYYSSSMTSFFEPTFAKNGGRILAKTGYKPPVNEKQLADSLPLLLKSNPELIFLPGYYTDVGTIIRQIRATGFQGPILGGDAWEEPLLLRFIDPRLLENTYYANHYAPDDNDPNVQHFVIRYREQNASEEPIQAAVLAYDAATLLFDAIRRAKSSDSLKIRDALEQTKDLPVITGRITIDEHHNPSKSAVVIGIKNGKGRFVQRVNP